MIIRLFDSELNLAGEIDDFQSCIIARKYLGIETLEMTIPLQSRNAERLSRHSILWVGERKVFEILHRSVDYPGVAMAKITAFSFGKTLAKRLTVPPNLAYDTATGSADAVVKQYIQNNLVSPVDPDRAVHYMQTAPVRDGVGITDRTRYKNLNDEVMRVLQAAGQGYFFTLDLDAKKIVFDTYPGLNRTVGNGLHPPAIFSLEYDNILSQTYTDSMADAQNQVYVGGRGEEEDRIIVRVGDFSGIRRFEAFQDARDTEDEGELVNRGLAGQNPGAVNFEARINPYGNLTYQKDYDLGDRVTVQDKRLGITMDTRITEVKETYQQGQADGVEITFGEKYPSFLSSIKSQQKQINQLASR